MRKTWKLTWIIAAILLSLAAYWGIYKISSPLLDRYFVAEQKGYKLIHHDDSARLTFLEKELQRSTELLEKAHERLKNIVPLTIVVLIWMTILIIRYVKEGREIDRSSKESRERWKMAKRE